MSINTALVAICAFLLRPNVTIGSSPGGDSRVDLLHSDICKKEERFLDRVADGKCVQAYHKIIEYIAQDIVGRNLSAQIETTQRLL